MTHLALLVTIAYALIIVAVYCLVPSPLCWIIMVMLCALALMFAFGTINQTDYSKGIFDD